MNLAEVYLWNVVCIMSYTQWFIVISPTRARYHCFLLSLFRLCAFAAGSIILWGDLNFVLDPALDSSASMPPLSHSTLNWLKQAFHNTRLCDVWCLLNPTNKDYSFFSAPHNTYSRSDYIFISPDILDCSPSAYIDPILLSDHTPVNLSIAVPNRPRCFRSWQLNGNLLQDPTCLKQIDSP